MRSAIHALIIGLLIVLGFTVTNANADVLGELHGIVCDPLKLGAGSENILKAVERMNVLIDKINQTEGQANADLKERISQIQEIVDRVMADVDKNVDNLKALVKDFESQVDSFEKQIYADASKLLFQATCVVEQAGSDQIQRALAAAIADIIRADPHVSILGVRVVSLNANQIDILDPDMAYISIRDNKYLKDLTTLRDDDSAYKIISAYSNIIRFAKFATCSYQNNPLVLEDLLREQFEYARLLAPWRSIAPKMK